jgi:hypothetical protein
MFQALVLACMVFQPTKCWQLEDQRGPYSSYEKCEARAMEMARSVHTHERVSACILEMSGFAEREIKHMMSLLGSLLGFGTSFLPEVLNFFKAGQEHKQKLETMKMEAELMEKRSALKLQELDKQADIAETKAYTSMTEVLMREDLSTLLRGSVRLLLLMPSFDVCSRRSCIIVKVLGAVGTGKML